MSARRSIRAGIAILASLAGTFALTSQAALAAELERPQTESTTAITGTTATLNGELNPGVSEEKIKYRFDYSPGGGECTESGRTAPAEPPFPESEGKQQHVSEALSGLEGSSEYTVCLVAIDLANEQETSVGPPIAFKTLAEKPIVELGSEKASGVGSRSATFEASVNAENQETSVVFEYANKESALLEGKGARVPAGASIPAVGGYQFVYQLANGLEPATSYYLRVAATNSTGTTYGPVVTPSFATLAVPLVEETQPEATEVTQHTALIGDITINPQIRKPEEGEVGEEATYYILFGETAAYGQALPAPIHASAGYGFTGSPVAPVALYDLTPGTTYHYAIVAHNANGTQTGRDRQFTTAAAQPLTTPPAVGSETAQFINESGTVIQGDINPEGLETTYAVQYGASIAYGSSTAGSVALAPFTSSQGTITSLVGLSPGTLYHYRIVATSQAGTTYGEDETFTTSGAPTTSPFTSFAIPVVPLIGQTVVTFPAEEPSGENAAKALTAKQKLSLALKACAKKPRKQRANCKKQARTKYSRSKHKR